MDDHIILPKHTRITKSIDLFFAVVTVSDDSFSLDITMQQGPITNTKLNELSVLVGSISYG